MTAKVALLKAIAGKNRGLLAQETDKQAILDAIAQLEAVNPTPDPMAALDRLEGDWRLLYTTSQQLLGFDQLPLVQVGQIHQCIRTADLSLYNVLELQGIPWLEGIICVTAHLTPVTERRVQVNFERSVLGLQRLINYHSPDEFVYQLRSGHSILALNLPLDRQRQQGWLETTYLDNDLRIGRGSRDSVFVLTKA